MGIHVHPIPVAPGQVDSWVSINRDIAVARATGVITRVVFNRTDEAGTVTAEIRNPGGDAISVSMLTGTDTAEGTGSITIVDGDVISIRVTAADAASMNLGGEYDLESVVAATTYLTTLARVKSFLRFTDSTYDAILNELIPGISLAMEGFMGRSLVSTAVTAEIHEVQAAGRDRLALDQWPLVTMTAVRENGTVLTAADWRDLGAGLIQRISGTPVAARSWEMGYAEFDYTYGYAAIPEDLVIAATSEAVLAFEQTRHGSSRLGKSSATFPGQTDAQFISAWSPLPYSKVIMQSYRRAL